MLIVGVRAPGVFQLSRLVTFTERSVVPTATDLKIVCQPLVAESTCKSTG